MNRALQIALVLDVGHILQAVFGQQLAVEHDMVLGGNAIPKLFQIGAQQPFEAMVMPVLEHAIQPGAVHQFGWRHGLEKIQGMGPATEELPGATALAPFQVVGVLPGHSGAVLLDPGQQCRGVVGDFLGQCARLFKARLQEGLGASLLVSIVRPL